MKYIRTKDGIEKLDTDREHLAEYMNGKQANTIEELCDRYVVDKRVYTIKGFEKYINYRMKQDRCSPKRTRQKIIGETTYYHDIYGAIWTGKGLIYVAKMNEKGELELL